MAEHDSAQERTEDATPKRLDEARRRGQIPRSRDLSIAAVTLGGGMALSMTGAQIAGTMQELMVKGLALNRDQALDTIHMLPALSAAAIHGFRACAPVLGTVFLAALLAPLALGGWSFSTEALMPQFSRLNPAEGIRRMFAMRSLVELGKALAKFGIVGLVAVIVLWKDAPALIAIGRE